MPLYKCTFDSKARSKYSKPLNLDRYERRSSFSLNISTVEKNKFVIKKRLSCLKIKMYVIHKWHYCKTFVTLTWFFTINVLINLFRHFVVALWKFQTMGVFKICNFLKILLVWLRCVFLWYIFVAKLASRTYVTLLCIENHVRTPLCWKIEQLLIIHSEYWFWPIPNFFEEEF